MRDHLRILGAERFFLSNARHLDYLDYAPGLWTGFKTPTSEMNGYRGYRVAHPEHPNSPIFCRFRRSLQNPVFRHAKLHSATDRAQTLPITYPVQLQSLSLTFFETQ